MATSIKANPEKAPEQEILVWNLENGFYEFVPWGSYGRFFVLGGSGNWRYLLSLEKDDASWSPVGPRPIGPTVTVVRKFTNVELS